MKNQNLKKFDCICFGPAPADEMAAQVGDADYREQSTRESEAFLNQLRRFRPIPRELEGDAYFEIKTDWGGNEPKSEVRLCFNPLNTAAVEYAFRLDGECPLTWDTRALEELGIKGAEVNLLSVKQSSANALHRS